MHPYAHAHAHIYSRKVLTADHTKAEMTERKDRPIPMLRRGRARTPPLQQLAMHARRYFCVCLYAYLCKLSEGASWTPPEQ